MEHGGSTATEEHRLTICVVVSMRMSPQACVVSRAFCGGGGFCLVSRCQTAVSFEGLGLVACLLRGSQRLPSFCVLVCFLFRGNRCLRSCCAGERGRAALLL